MLTKIGFGADRLQQIASRPLMSDQWRATEAAAPKAEDIRVPMLFIGGWYDIYTDSVLGSFLQIRARGGEKARRHSKPIMGPWIHAYEDKRTGSLDFPAPEWYGMKKARLPRLLAAGYSQRVRRKRTGDLVLPDGRG